MYRLEKWRALRGEKSNAVEHKRKDLRSVKVGSDWMVRLIDCHAHFHPPEFPLEEIKSLLSRSPHDFYSIDLNNLDLTVIAVSETLQQAHQLIELTQIFPGKLLACIGLHPVYVTEIFYSCGMDGLESELRRLRELAETNRHLICGIGEVGLDYCRQTLQPPIPADCSFRNHTQQGFPNEMIAECKAAQQFAFAEQIRLAAELSLPLNVHSRQAGHYAIEQLHHMNAQKVLMHAFDGSWRYVGQALQYGYYFSVPPSVLRSSSSSSGGGGGGMSGWVNRIPLDHLLLESDSPALGPVRGERNQPWNCLITAKYLSNTHKIPMNDIIDATTRNATNLFSII